jgi:hypothetical protein
MARPVSGEVVGASRAERFQAAERRIRRVTDVLDEAFTVPGTNVRAGLDPVIGLIPFVGDAVAALVGIWVIAEATRFGIPRIVVARMSVNLLIDLAIGAIPLIGDIYDVTMRSNSRNLGLFREHALDPDASTRGHQAFFAGLVLMLVGAIWLVIVLVVRLWEWFLAAIG